MTGLPTITADGTLVGDPELRFTPGGTAVAKWRIACNERRYDQATGQWTDGATTYLTGSCWRDLGEHAAASLKKGDRVIVTGVLRQREWQHEDGTKRTEYEIDAASMGPSLAFGTAMLKKASKTKAGGHHADPDDDPWTSATSADDEVPF